MATEADLADAIATSAQGPKKASGDEGTFETHSLPDQIAADEYLANKAAAKKPHRALKFAKMTRPGAA
jgi:hypothetical protein